MQLAVAAFVCPLEHAMRFGEGTAAEGLDCGVPVPFPSFTRACLCVVVKGDRARHTRQAQQRGRAQMAAFWPCELFWVQSYPNLKNKKDGHFSRSARFVEIAPSARSPPPEFFERRRGSFSASHPPTLGRLDSGQAQQKQLAAPGPYSHQVRVLRE